MDDTDKIVALALLTKYAAALRANVDDRATIDAAQARIEARTKPMEQIDAIFGDVLGLKSKNKFLELRKLVGVVAYNDALLKAGYDQSFLSYEEEGPSLGKASNDTIAPADKSVRDLVIERLKASRTTGVKAADIRKYIEKARSTELHEKTVGMTLYRLLKDGIARRDGHTWFYVPPEAETQNPGVSAPGPINRDD